MSTGQCRGAVLAWPGTARRHVQRCLVLIGQTLLLWTAALAILIGHTGGAFAQTPSQVIYGPVSVTLPSSSLFSFSGSFTSPASATGPYLLRVQLSAANSLTSLSFKLNNVQVLALADFSGGITLVDRTVTVLTNDTYSIQVAGKAKTVITVTVFATPNLPKPTSLTPNPLNVTLGANGTLTAALSPTPTAAGTLNVSSANAAVATVPASVSFVSGQTSVAIPVTTHAVGNAVITATANGGSASSTVSVTPAPPTVTSLAPGTLALSQGSSGNLAVTISAAQITDTFVSLATSAAGVAAVPDSVVVPAGALSASLSVNAVAQGNAQISASLNGSTATSQITVTPAPVTVVSLLPAVSSVTRGASSTLTLTISSAQSADTVVPLAVSPPGIVFAPAQLTVAAGQTTALVAISGVAFGQAGVTASLNGSSASAIVNVIAPPVAVTTLEPAIFSLNVGATGSFTVSINAAQPVATTIGLAVDDAAVLQVPASVPVAPGSTSATFTATGLTPGNAVIAASANGTSKSSSVHVSPQPAAIVSLLPNPLPLQQGATGSLTVTINVAQEADTVIALASDAPAVAQVAASVTIAAGAVSALIPVGAVAPGTANITASVNGSSVATVVSVTPPPPVVTSVAPATLTLPKGTPGTLRVTVSNAPIQATAVALTSNAQAIASVPATVNIAAGALFADFPVAANSVGTATITASLGEGSATASVTVTPAELATITLSPQTPTVYVIERVQFNASGTFTDGSSRILTTGLSWTSSNISVATVGTTGFVRTVSAGSTTISARSTFISAIDGSIQTVTGSTVLTVKEPVALVLAAPATVVAGNTATVIITSIDPAPAGGLVVSLSAVGNGSATFPAAVSIPAGGTTASFSLTASTAGDLTLTATAFERLPGLVSLTILEALKVVTISPASGPVGTLVGLTGTGFDPVSANNQVSFPGANGIPVAAGVVTASPTLITLAVPAAAVSGPITVGNTRGTAASPPFTVTAPGTSPAVNLSIASPANGAVIGSDTVAVSGTLQGPLNAGVVVNGVVAAVTGNTFTAAAVPLQLGLNTLTVTAVALDGQTTTQSVSVTSSGPAPIQVVGDITQGLAPLMVNFTVKNTSGKGLLSIQADFTGSGIFSFFSPNSPISNSYTVPGTYQANFIVFDNSGASVQQAITIVVQDAVQVDQILQTAWNGFATALALRDTAGAIRYFSPQVQDKYLGAFQALNTSLPQIVGTFSPLQLMSVSGGVGEYAINRVIDGVNRIFLMYFIQGVDGVWRIDAM